MNASSEDVARMLNEVIPMVMRRIRHEMRNQGSNWLTPPQFRVLMHLDRNPGVSLLNLAEHLGLTSPTVSKMIDTLVGEQMVIRQSSSQDRRKIILDLTPQGKVILEKARTATQLYLSNLMIDLNDSQRQCIFDSMGYLEAIFRCD